MSLPRQMVEMPFAQGLDTKRDPFQIPLGKMLTLQNAVFTAPGKIQKRNGYAALVQSVLGGGFITTPTALFARANELCQIGDPAAGSLYSYDQSNTAWALKGKMPSIGVTAASVAQPQYSTYSIDMAVASNGLQCFVYELIDTNAPLARKGIGYTVVDPGTGQVVVPPSILETDLTSGSPHVVAYLNTFACYYIKGVPAASAAILGRTLSAAAPLSGWSGATTLTSGTTTSALSFGSQFNFDVCLDATRANGYMVFAARDGSTGIFKLTSPLVVGSSTNTATTGQTQTIFMDVNGNIAVGISSGTGRFTVLDTSLSIVKALTLLGSTEIGGAITGTSTAAGALTFFTSSTGSTNSQAISAATVGGVTYGTIASSVIVRSLGISAKAFTVNGAAYIPAWYCANTVSGGLTRFMSPQNAIYLLDASGRVISKALVGTTGGFDTISLFDFLSSPAYQLGASIVSGTNVTFAASNTNVLESVVASSRFGTTTPGTAPLLLNYNFGATALTFAFGDAVNGYQRQQISNTVHVNGGVLQMYDGQNVVEHGFLIYPAFITVSLGGGGALGAGSYQVCATYEWMDGQGQVHRSTPSTPVTFTATAGQAATYIAPTLRVTAKTGVVVQLYRTLVNQTEFFQITNFNSAGSLFSDPAFDTVTWVDSQSDTAIAGNPPLYTTGGVLDNESVNPAGAMVVHRNRLFVVDSTNPTQIWYSKQVVPPAPVEFSGFLILNVDPKGGPITALASLDDKLIVFKGDRVFEVLGQGPDSTGNQNDFTDAFLVSSDTGCAVPKSVVVVPDGIMYQSPKGIFQLSRALQVSYIGAELERIMPTGLTFASVTCAVMVSTVTQVRFGTPFFAVTGNPLGVTYDYLVGQWSVYSFSDNSAVTRDGCVVNGQYYAITDNTGIGVIQENVGSQVDSVNGGIPIEMALTTGWIKLTGLQGFQRAYKMLLLGTGDGNITVRIAYDYDPTILQTTTFAKNAGVRWQQRIDFQRQKCEAFQFSVTDDGSLLSLSGASMEIGAKKGPAYKLPATNGSG